MPEMNNYFCSLMKRRAIIPDPVLMLLSILLVASFQVYWLKNNYDREKRSLQIKTNIDFQETVRHLQAIKLNVGDTPDSVYNKHLRIMIDDNEASSAEETNINWKVKSGERVITMVNAARHETQKLPGHKTITTIIRSDSLVKEGDSLTGKNNNILQLLYKVDSLQDTLKLSEIKTAFTKRQKDDKTIVPFSIHVIDSALNGEDDLDFSNVTVGFAHPKTYHLELGNTFPFLIKKIAPPIIFSVFLVGLTILAFWILYRNLMRQRKLAAIKNEFISNITHELKTPIATVGVAIEALRNFDAGHDPVKTKEYLDISAAELQRLSMLVDKVLKLSIFENRTVELKKEPVDMRKLANEVIQMLKLQFEKQHAKVDMKTSGDLFIIEADRLHMSSVLYNLLDNALKYGPENAVITIKLTSLSQDILEIKVKDNGPGIDKEYQSKVFDKFFRIPQGEQHNIKGYGLGLSYVKEIVVSHGGNILVESEPGNGSTFIITLPMKKSVNAEQEKQPNDV